MLLEEALREVGDFGRFQWLLIVYLCVFVAPLRVLPLFGHIFSLLVPPHRCRLDPRLQEALGDLSNATRGDGDLLLDLALPREPDGSFSQCHMYDANSTLALWFDVAAESTRVANASTVTGVRDIVPCQFGWEYDFSYFYPSVVSEVSVLSCDTLQSTAICGTTYRTHDCPAYGDERLAFGRSQGRLNGGFMTESGPYCEVVVFGDSAALRDRQNSALSPIATISGYGP